MPSRILIAGLLTTGAMLGIAPVAHAEPVPGPEPVPVPAPGPETDGAGCQDGEVMQDGNCVPDMSPPGGGDFSAPEPPLRYTDDHTSTTQSGLPADLVPNLDGTPCTGYWMSPACYEMNQSQGPAVVPRSTISSSP